MTGFVQLPSWAWNILPWSQSVVDIICISDCSTNSFVSKSSRPLLLVSVVTPAEIDLFAVLFHAKILISFQKSEYWISKVEMLLCIFYPVAKETLCHTWKYIHANFLSKMDSEDNPGNSACCIFYWESSNICLKEVIERYPIYFKKQSWNATSPVLRVSSGGSIREWSYSLELQKKHTYGIRDNSSAFIRFVLCLRVCWKSQLEQHTMPSSFYSTIPSPHTFFPFCYVRHTLTCIFSKNIHHNFPECLPHGIYLTEYKHWTTW